MTAINSLFYGDNLGVLRESIATESIDLIYLDPPFNSAQDYNVLFSSPSGESSESQITAFEDTWHWGPEAEHEFGELVRLGHGELAEAVVALRRVLGENDLMAYLVMMANRLVEMHRVLKTTGSLYLHCDTAASHYLKLVLDAVFGGENFRNEISWKRSSTRSSISRVFRRSHDVIFFYSKSKDYFFDVQYRGLSDGSLKQYSNEDERGTYRLAPLLVSGKRGGVTGTPWRGIDPNTHGKSGMHWVTTHEKLERYDDEGLVHWPAKEGGAPNLKYYLAESPGVPVSDFWDDISVITSNSAESLGYPTQKPIALLERILRASSRPGDVVLDPFCGCGTAVHAAQKLGRSWIGIDITHLAISLIEKRLKDKFPGIEFEVHGTPRDLHGAQDLALRDKYQFQWWACSLVDSQPFQGKKKGADGGIDGLIYFQDAPGGHKKAIVSVKGGQNVSVAMIRDLVGVVEREKAAIGIFITLVEPSKPMASEALKAGFYESPNGKAYQRIQILTVGDLLDGKASADYPDLASGGITFKKGNVEPGNAVLF